MSIINKTICNVSVFSEVSSGKIDNVMYEDAYETDTEMPIDQDLFENLPTGNRITTFLNQLDNEYFLTNLDYLGVGLSHYITFSTTKDYGFSLSSKGNNIDKELILSNSASKWSMGNCMNLAAYFEGYPEGQVLNFEFLIHKPTSYQLEIDIQVSE